MSGSCYQSENVSFTLLNSAFLEMDMPVLQCFRFCFYFALCKSATVLLDSGRCSLNYNDIGRTDLLQNTQNALTVSKQNMSQDLAGTCKGHACNNGKMCYPLKNSAKCIDHGAVASICPPGWTVSPDSCLYDTGQKESYLDGLKTCSSMNASLVEIHSAEKQSFLFPGYTEANIWIGLYLSQNKSYWMSGTRVAFTFWYNEARYVGGRKCVYTGYSHKWVDKQCFVELSIICERMFVV